MELSSFTNLFQNLQEYVVRILNEDEILQQMGCSFLSENSLDIEYQIREALNKQGLACLVMTPKATYQGHNGIQQTFTCDELTIQIVENPIINRARLKKAGLEHGTCLDVAKQASDRLAGPQGGYFGQFTTKRIQESESGGLLVCTATFGCTVYERLDAVLSGDLSGKWVEVPFVRTSELSDYIDDYLSTHMPAIEGYLPLSGGEISGDISFQSNNSLFWGDQNYHDAYIMGGSPGLVVYNDADEQWRFKSSALPESDDDVMRRRDLSAMTPYEIDQYETVIWRFDGVKEVVNLSGEVSLEDIEGLGDLSSIVSIDFGTGVSALGDYSCSGLTYLYNVHCARTLRRIGEGAFYNTRAIGLAGFVIDPQRDIYHYPTSQNVQTEEKSLVIETSAFANCYYLSYVQLPNLFQTYIGEDAFKGAFQSNYYSLYYPQRGIFFYGTPYAAFESDTYINAYNLSEVSSYVRAFNPTSYEWVTEQHYGKDFTYTNFEWTILGPSFAIASMENKAFYYNPLSVAPFPSRARTKRVYISELTADHTAREIYALLSVQSDFDDSRIAKFTTGAPVDKYLNGDLSTFTREFLKPGTKHFWHFFEYEPNKFYVEEMNTPPSYLSDYVKATNTTPLTLTVPYDYGLTIQTPNGTPLLETIDLNRTAIANLSAGNIETGSYVKTNPDASVDPTALSAWDWIKTRETGLGTILQNQHNAILGEVSEDFVSFNWLIQQGYATSAQMNEALSNYLPLSGGQMEGGIRWDYGGMGGPQIYGPYSPQQLAFTTTYQPDEQKMIFLDFGRIEEATGQRTIAFVEDIEAVLGDISALIHAT